MSAKSKGDAVEREVEAILKKDKDNLTFKAQRTMKFIGKGRFVSQANDFFGKFDLIVKNKKGMTRWIQVKSDPSDVSKAKPGIEEFYNEYCNKESETVEIWLKVARKGFVRYLYFGSWIKGYMSLQGEFKKKFKITKG